MRKSGHPTSSSQINSYLLGVAAIAIASGIVYWPALRGGFILDDNLYLTANPLIAAGDGLYRFWFSTDAVDYYPVSNTALWLEWRLWGLNPVGYHVTNLALHISAAILIWLILRKLSIPGALLAALLFAVHPVNVESVGWISQRKGLLAATFFLLSVLCYLREEEGQPLVESTGSSSITRAGRWYWLSLLSFLLAVLSKGSVVILPLLLPLIVWWQHRKLTVSDMVRTVPFWAIATVLTGVNIWCQARLSAEPFRTAGFAGRLAGAGAVVWFYLSKALLPIHLAFIYPNWQIQSGNWLWWIPLAAATLVTATLTWQRNSSWGRPLFFAWIFFCLCLVPVMGFADVGFMKHSLVADHYQYIAIISWTALIAAAWSFWYSQARGALRKVAISAAMALVAVLMILGWHQSQLYSNARTLYAASLKENPDSWLLHFNLANALDDDNRPDEAIQQYREAIKKKPDFYEAIYNFGNSLAKTGQTKEAADQYERTLELKPDWAAQIHCALGILQANAGNPQQAAVEYQQAVSLQPDSPEFHYNLGNAFLALGRSTDASEQYHQALKLKPEFSDARMKLDSISAQSGVTNSIETYKHVVELNPENAEGHYNLGNALMRSGQIQPAIVQYERALQLKPEFPEALNGLGAALVAIGKASEAREFLKQALKLKPDYPEAYANLSLAWAKSNDPVQAIRAAEKAIELARSEPDRLIPKH